MQNMKATLKGKKGPVAARLFMLFARNSPTAVIFRRGPSKWVQLVKWDTRTDTFQQGQWFHGRIYERRSDISPDGSLLVYFAQKIKARTIKDSEYTYAWTAVSRPPYLTALALWPKGDCWHGGGLFDDDKTLVLNHKPAVARPHPNHMPRGIRVKLKKDVSGEDDPLFSERLQRDGWILKQEWKIENRGYPKMFLTHQPEIREKVSEDESQVLRLTRSIEGLDYSEEFTLLKNGQREMLDLDRASWVDWDQQRRLVYAKDGKIFAGRLGDDGQLVERKLKDLNPSKPETVPPPEWAVRW